MSTVYLNGQFLPETQAKVSVLDRGLLFGDAVYEVIPAYDGKLFHPDAHLVRLEASLELLKIPVPLPRAAWHDVLAQLLAANPAEHQSIYLQVTRGVMQARQHLYPQAAMEPTVFAFMQSLTFPDPQQLAQGYRVITHRDTRWAHCHIKATTLLANVLLRQQALAADAQEVILIRDGQVIEGASSNVFLVRDGVVVTPPECEAMMAGVTRDVVLELVRALQLPLDVRPVAQEELFMTQEIWLTGSSRAVVPVLRVDDHTVGDGHPGPLWQQVIARYIAAIQ